MKILNTMLGRQAIAAALVLSLAIPMSVGAFAEEPAAADPDAEPAPQEPADAQPAAEPAAPAADEAEPADAAEDEAAEVSSEDFWAKDESQLKLDPPPADMKPEEPDYDAFQGVKFSE